MALLDVFVVALFLSGVVAEVGDIVTLGVDPLGFAALVLACGVYYFHSYLCASVRLSLQEGEESGRCLRGFVSWSTRRTSKPFQMNIKACHIYIYICLSILLNFTFLKFLVCFRLR